jgi:hypothetical protein
MTPVAEIRRQNTPDFSFRRRIVSSHSFRGRTVLLAGALVAFASHAAAQVTSSQNRAPGVCPVQYVDGPTPAADPADWTARYPESLGLPTLAGVSLPPGSREIRVWLHRGYTPGYLTRLITRGSWVCGEAYLLNALESGGVRGTFRRPISWRRVVRTFDSLGVNDLPDLIRTGGFGRIRYSHPSSMVVEILRADAYRRYGYAVGYEGRGSDEAGMILTYALLIAMSANESRSWFGGNISDAGDIPRQPPAASTRCHEWAEHYMGAELRLGRVGCVRVQ